MPDPGLELRHLRTFVAVAKRRSFTRAADDLHIAQQAVSQQVRVLERTLGVTLLHRTSRNVELTPEGQVFLVDSRRVLAAADRAAWRVKAAARGEVGTLRLAYTLTTVWDTVPRLLARMSEAEPRVKVQAREVFGADIDDLLLDGRCDLGLAPRTSYPKGLQSLPVRRETMRVALSSSDPISARKRIELSTLANRSFELWPRDMAPGFYDTVVAACRTAGFEPSLDEQATGNTVWGNLARGWGVALINASLAEQLPRGVVLVDLAQPVELTYEAVWLPGEGPLIDRSLGVATGLAHEVGWL
ncbi:MAG TPA: LysR substrate-binding domain-containing protein [Acidimicrobiales bacterium]|nr:LysR substrate-binding domain-containing protein [Acidimicrobiales bacterium]